MGTVADRFARNMADENNPLYKKQEHVDLDDDIYVDFEEIDDDEEK